MNAVACNWATTCAAAVLALASAACTSTGNEREPARSETWRVVDSKSGTAVPDAWVFVRYRRTVATPVKALELCMQVGLEQANKQGEVSFPIMSDSRISPMAYRQGYVSEARPVDEQRKVLYLRRADTGDDAVRDRDLAEFSSITCDHAGRNVQPIIDLLSIIVADVKSEARERDLEALKKLELGLRASKYIARGGVI